MNEERISFIAYWIENNNQWSLYIYIYWKYDEVDI